MVIFVPAWLKGIDGTVSSSMDDLLGPIKAFEVCKKNYLVLVNDYLPNLRYFLHSHDLLEINYLSIFDELQGFTVAKQRKVNLNDLNYPKDSSFIYTPFHILVLQKKEVIGQILLGEGSYISEARYLQRQQIDYIQIYDDRGFLSSQKIFKSGEEKYTEFLDSQGEWIFKCFKDGGFCQVNPNNSRGLLLQQYETVEAVKFERMEMELSKFHKLHPIIISITDQNIEFVYQSQKLKEMVISIFQDRIKNLLCQGDLNFLGVLKNAKSIVVDQESTLKKISNLLPQSNNIYKLSPYGSQFELSISQEIKDEIIFVDLRKMTDKSREILVVLLVEFLIKKYNIEENERKFKIFLRVNSMRKLDALNVLNDIFREYFSEELLILEEQNKKNDFGENTIDEDVNTITPEIRLAKMVTESVEVMEDLSDDELLKLINATRIIVDLGEEPDLFTQICGISAAIPQINSIKTEYIQNKENGLILKNIDEIGQALIYYLDELRNWQDARVAAVRQIKKYSGDMLCKRILEISRGIDNGR